MQALLLLTGFLGAGKTTTLRRLALALSERGLAVHAVLNDYRNAEIDSATLRDAVGSLAAISGSCVCCESRDELFDALATLPRDEPGVVLVEANGGSDPVELIELIALDPRCRHLAPPRVVGVVHTGRWQKRLFRRGLERSQLRAVGQVLLTHQEEANEERLRLVRQQLGRANPSAREVGIETLIDELAQLARHLEGRDRQVETKQAARSRQTAMPKGHLALSSVELAVPERWDSEECSQFFRSLPETVIRAKGLVQFADRHSLVVVQYTDDGRLEQIPLEIEGEYTPSLVLIGPDLDRDPLQSMLDASVKSRQG